MADLAIGVARSVVEGTITKVQAAIDEELKLRQDTQRDLTFITGELKMMQSFLGDVDKERAKNNVIKSWAEQVRDLAYDVEDGIELVAHLDNNPDWWRRLLPGCMAAVLPLDKAAAEIKQLKPRTVDVSRRITQYGLSLTGIIDLGSRPIMHTVSAAAPSLVEGARDTTTGKLQGLGEWELMQLILKKNDRLAVISVWGGGNGLGRTSVIRKVYQDEAIRQKFGCLGCIRLTHPFNRHEFLKSLVTQLYTNSCLEYGVPVDEDQRRRVTETTAEELINVLKKQLDCTRYLIILENLCTLEEWNAIRACLPEDQKNGSCIIVSTKQKKIATSCIGDLYQTLEFKPSSLGYHLCLFFEEDSRGNNDISMDEVSHVGFGLIERESQTHEVRTHLTRALFNDWQVISVWGIAGVGKSILIRNLYNKIVHQENPRMFDKFGWVEVSHPFNLRNFSRSLLLDVRSVSIEALGIEDPIQECHKFLKVHRCLVVIDGVKSTEEWDLLQAALVSKHSKSVIIVITTEETIGTYCADNEDVVLNIKGLDAEESFDLFRKKVQRKNPDSPLLRASNDRELKELILKCGGLPKVIVSVADYLAPKNETTCMASTRTLNHTFMHSLQCNSEFVGVRGLFHWLEAYIGAWPDFLKQCILYLSVFSRYHLIRRRRLLRRWVAEGYIKDSQTVSAEETGERSFSRLLGVCITEPSPHSVSSIISDTRTDLFQINRFVGQYILSQPMEENLFFELDESCTVAAQRIGRHLSIRKKWARDRTVFESIEFSRLRSLTVSGSWESFFISESMNVLRVLDLEDSSGLTDKDLGKIVKLLSRLKFLSLRGCSKIRNLPSRLGDLRQLETLDVRGTAVHTLPGTTVQLKKLQYMRAGPTPEPFIRCASVLGVNLREGIEELTLLTTLGVIDISAAVVKAIVKVLSKLTRLRKLGVSGVSRNNSKDFFTAISGHGRLESLLLWLSKENGYFLDDITSSHFEDPQHKPVQNPPLQNLESLKIYGLVCGVPTWIKYLPKLTKLELEITISVQAAQAEQATQAAQAIQADMIIRVLGEIEGLRILRLCVKPLEDGDGNKLDFRVMVNGYQRHCYSKLKILDITSTSRLNVSFGSQAMPNLELLTARCCSGSEVRFIEVNKLSTHKLKEVRLIGSYDTELKNDLEEKLKMHPRKPPLKLLKQDGKALIDV